MPKNEGCAKTYAAHDEAGNTAGRLRPALASIQASCVYMGGVSRAKFYADILPQLETVKLGKRNLVVVASMDRLIETGRTRPARLASPTELAQNPQRHSQSGLGKE
jgi:hypothetical protein